MTALLYGCHDREGRHILPAGGWCLDTLALSDNPAPTDYHALRADINWIVRLNWGYGATGTIPLPIRLDDFVQRCMNYVAKSNGANLWIIGNEPNHEQERPNGVYITPAMYAECFAKCRSAIKIANPAAQVIPAPIAPYHANPIPWTDYLREMLATIARNGGCDGIAIHAYTRSSNPDDINDDVRMGPPLENTCAGFLTYQDALEEVPAVLRHLPAYITEFNELLPDGWDDRNTGVVQAAYQHINWWNTEAADANEQQFQCVVLYRWPKFDKWHIEGKQGVIDDLRAAVAKGYQSPSASRNHAQNYSDDLFIPSLSAPGDNPAPPPKPEPTREIDPRLTQRSAMLIPVQVAPGQQYWRLIKASWRDEQQSQGRHHIFVDVLDEMGKRVVGVPVEMAWPGDGHTKPTEAKPSESYAVDFPMYNTAPAYSVHVLDGKPSDSLDGLGLGSIEQPEYNIHTSYDVVFQLATMPEAQAPTQPTPSPAIGYVIAPAGARIRSAPTTAAAILAAIPYGEQVRLLAVGDGWFRVQAGDVEGWMSADLIGISEPPPLPPTPPPTRLTNEADNWTRAIAFVRRWEGGFVNDPNDPGGATNKGITIDTYTRWRKAHNQPQPTVEELRAISDEETNRIYYEWYWKASGADLMPWPLALAHFDTAVNAGVGRAQEMFEKSGGTFLAYMGHLIIWYTTINNFDRYGRAWIRRRAEILLEAST